MLRKKNICVAFHYNNIISNMYLIQVISGSVLILCAIQFATSSHILDDEDDTIYDRNNHNVAKTFHN